MLSISLFRCRIEIGFSCFALFAFCCLFAGASNSAFLLLAATLHEGGHLLALYLLGSAPIRAEFSLLGCRIVLDPKKKLSYGKNALVSLAGPAANLLFFAGMTIFQGAEHSFAVANLGLGLLHLLPIEPLDGGLALRALLSRNKTDAAANRLSLVISLCFLFPLAVLGFLVLLHTRYNFSLLALSLYLMLYLLLKRDYLVG